MVDKDKDAVDKGALVNVTAALEALAESEKVDDTSLATISSIVENLNENTQKAILDLPAMQSIIQKVQESVAPADVKPGEYMTVGMFQFKKPYTKSDLVKVWGEEERWIAPRTEVVVTPGGWQFRLTEGIIYDIPRDVDRTAIPEGHGYKLPKIVIQIIEDSRLAMRQNKREQESERGFGAGVKFLGTGWAGKDNIVAAANDSPHPEPTTE